MAVLEKGRKTQGMDPDRSLSFLGTPQGGVGSLTLSANQCKKKIEDQGIHTGRAIKKVPGDLNQGWEKGDGRYERLIARSEAPCRE